MLSEGFEGAAWGTQGGKNTRVDHSWDRPTK